ncbi:hypothetical protein QAD02_003496 [Eretmocerus hayati]|uniref:Uncharacterized protein n=1 Tax=Eretmocerus hayati TaxID=131215 RepID=A0ACC2NPR7_9HYME|nr:hypothetical protein QAD02_003496 [Eretmocerus hayati]
MLSGCQFELKLYSFQHPTENESNDIPHTTNAGLPTESIVNQYHNNGNRIPDPRPKAPDDGDIPMLENMVSAMDVSISSDTDTESRESPPISNQDNIDGGDALDTHHNWVEERNEIMMDNEDQYVHLLRDDGAEVRDIVVQQEPIDPKVLVNFSLHGMYFALLKEIMFDAKFTARLEKVNPS